MDINLTKHTVNTEIELFSDTAEIILDGVIGNLHTGKPKKILGCYGKSAITSKNLSDKSVMLEGTTMICILYLDEDDCLCSHEHVLPFSKNFDADTSLSGGEIKAKITDERVMASLTAQNEIKLSGVLSLFVSVVKNKEQDIICDIDSKHVEQLRKTLEVTVKVGCGEKNLIAEEEISIGNGQPSVGKLIRHCATASIEEIKAINDKVMVKGSVKIYVLYLPEEGTRPQSFEDSFPFSQLVDVAGVNDGCRCDGKATVLFSDLTPRVGNDDEIRAFSVAVKLNVSVKAYCEGEVSALLDAYSTSGGCRVEKEELVFAKLKEKTKERTIARKGFEFTDGAIGSVIDMWCDLKNYFCRFEDGAFRLNATTTVCLLVYDCDGIPACYERPVEIEYAYKPEYRPENPEAECNITITHCTYTITGANTVEIAVEPQIELSVYDRIKQTFITELKEDPTLADKAPRNSSIVLYFADEGETLWDIARRYNSSIEEIKTLNSVTEDTLTAPHKFIIPTK